MLLILASVAITLAVDSNGLFQRAGQAANSWNTSVANESETVENLLGVLDEITGEITISSELPAGWNSGKVASVAKQGNKVVPIPVGYTVSDVAGENSIANGLVIYEGTEQVSTDSDAQTSRNQYVWVPVENINSMVMCRTHGAGTVSLDPETLQCPECGTETKLAGRTYAGAWYEDCLESQDEDGNYIYTARQDFNETNQSYEDDFQEPAVVADDEGNYHGLGSTTAFMNQLEEDFEEMARSVAKYGGFYVGRYEAGENGTSKKEQRVAIGVPEVELSQTARLATVATSVGGNTEPNSEIAVGADDWYGLYENTRNTSGNIVHSHMMWGSQYDQIMKFIGTESQEGHPDVQLPYPVKSGMNENDKMKNIYDLEGNYTEWTAQSYSGTNGGKGSDVSMNGNVQAKVELLSSSGPSFISIGRVARGGFWDVASNGLFGPAAIAYSFTPADGSSIVCARATLYVAL